MIRYLPFPHDVAVPVHFEDHVVEELLVGNLGIAGVAVREHKRIAGVGLGLHAGRVVAGGAAFALEIMMIAGHPAAGDTGIVDEFVPIELPDDIAVPVHLNDIKPVLHTVLAAAAATAGQQIAAGENLVGHPVIHKDGSDFLRLKNRKTVPASFGIVDGYTSGINGRMAHDMLLNL